MTIRKHTKTFWNGQRYTIYNCDFRDIPYPKGITISDVPYNQDYHYGFYKDNLEIKDYLNMLSGIPTPCVIIHYPEPTINLLPWVWGFCERAVSWVYNANTHRQHRSISWWGCKPDLQCYGQDYKNPNDKKNAKRIAEGKFARIYDWWEINQVKNTSKEKVHGDVTHPCQTPEQVVRQIIATTVPKGVTVIDPFLGSGTTGKVAIEMGYNFIGFEIDPEYYELAIQRLAKVKPGMTKPGIGYWMSQVAKAA